MKEKSLIFVTTVTRSTTKGKPNGRVSAKTMQCKNTKEAVKMCSNSHDNEFVSCFILSVSQDNKAFNFSIAVDNEIE